MNQLCRYHNLIWPTGVEGGPTFFLINPTASQIMSPTDLPQCRQLPGDSAKLLGHPESTLILGLECLLLDQELRLQLRSGECLQKLFTSTWEMKKPLGRGVSMSSKRPTMLPHKEITKRQTWKRLRDLFVQKSHCKQNNTSTTSYNNCQQEQACFTSHLRNVESHLQADVANTRFPLQQEYLARTSAVEERAAASESAYAQMHGELLEQRNQLQENQA